jgi:hypothetical protein
VRSLSQISFFNLKKLFSEEDLVAPGEPELQMELEGESLDAQLVRLKML